jgi:hypothetical protein
MNTGLNKGSVPFAKLLDILSHEVTIMKNLRYIKIFILIVFLAAISYAVFYFNSADYCYICENSNYSVFSDNANDWLFVGCAGNSETLDLRVVNPQTLEIIKIFELDGLLKKAIGVDNGNAILALLSEVDGQEMTHDGKLVKIDFNTGEILCEYPFPDRMPLAMVTDCQQNYVYLTVGYEIEYEDTPPQLYKLGIADLSVVDTAVIGEIAENIEITSDDAKLYTDDGGVQVRYDFDGFRASNTEYYYEISVIQTSNLNEITNIELNIPTSRLEMGYDNRLFVGYCGPEEYNDVALVVIDTNTDQIISSMVFGSDDKEGINFMECDPIAHKLYCTTNEYGHWDSELQGYVHKPSSKILKIDLNNYSHEFVSTGTDPLWQIAALYKPDSCRLFCTADNSDRKLIYVDQ